MNHPGSVCNFSKNAFICNVETRLLEGQDGMIAIFPSAFPAAHTSGHFCIVVSPGDASLVAAFVAGVFLGVDR
jgi:hypothetical protein